LYRKAAYHILCALDSMLLFASGRGFPLSEPWGPLLEVPLLPPLLPHMAPASLRTLV
jgi:hypothetical protein